MLELMGKSNLADEVTIHEWSEQHFGVDIPHAETVVYTDDPRAAFVGKMRELADRVENGALNGARCEWNDNPDQPAMVYVECFPPTPTVDDAERARYGDMKRSTRLVRVTFESARRPRLVSPEGT